MKSWRVIGRWLGGGTVLFLMGYYRSECFHRLKKAMRQYTMEDLRMLDELWLEEWKDGKWVKAPGLETMLGKLRQARWHAANKAKKPNFKMVG